MDRAAGSHSGEEESRTVATALRSRHTTLIMANATLEKSAAAVDGGNDGATKPPRPPIKVPKKPNCLSALFVSYMNPVRYSTHHAASTP